MKWFKHMCDASNGEFLSEIEDLFGLEGYARWFKLLEAVGAAMDETDRCSVAYPWEKWQTILKGKRKKLETFLGHLENKSRINRKQTGNILEISIPKMPDLRDEWSKKLRRNSGPDTEVDKDIRNKNKITLPCKENESKNGREGEQSFSEKEPNEMQRLAQSGMEYLTSLNSPNFAHNSWVLAYLRDTFQELEQSNPVLSNQDVLRCWKDACDLAIENQAQSGTWIKTTFQNRICDLATTGGTCRATGYSK